MPGSQPTAVVESWAASYYVPQSLEILQQRARPTQAMHLSYDFLMRFTRPIGPSAIVVRGDDYRLAFQAGKGWFTVNRYGIAQWQGKSWAFDIGAFADSWKGPTRDPLIGHYGVKFINHTNKALELATSNGIPIGLVPPKKDFDWARGWAVGIVEKNPLEPHALLADIGRAGLHVWAKPDSRFTVSVTYPSSSKAVVNIDSSEQPALRPGHTFQVLCYPLDWSCTYPLYKGYFDTGRYSGIGIYSMTLLRREDFRRLLALLQKPGIPDPYRESETRMKVVTPDEKVIWLDGEGSRQSRDYPEINDTRLKKEDFDRLKKWIQTHVPPT